MNGESNRNPDERVWNVVRGSDLLGWKNEIEDRVYMNERN